MDSVDSSLVPLENIQDRIVLLRGQRVLLDRDLAGLYGVATKQLNQQIKRNPRKFPADFMFELTAAEKNEVVTKCDRLRALKFSASLPHAFTEHGALQAANVLNSDAAVAMSVHIVRAFNRLRHLVINHKAIAGKLGELDARVSAHDEQLAALIAALRQLTSPAAPPASRKIGFHTGNR